MTNTDDLRYRRTEAAIREAFLRLLGEMPLEKIGVKRLCDEALTGLLDAFDDMHRGPAEVMTRYLVNGTHETEMILASGQKRRW